MQSTFSSSSTSPATRVTGTDSSVHPPNNPLAKLPFGVVISILSFLTSQDLLQCMLVSRRWKQQIYSPSSSLQHTLLVWRPLQDAAGNVSLLTITLPHLRRLQVYLSIRLFNHIDLSACQAAFDFAVDDVTRHCRHLIELQLHSEIYHFVVVMPPLLLRLPHTLQKLSVSGIITVGDSDLAIVGQSCPNLISLKLTQRGRQVMSPATLCQTIGESLMKLQVLVLPNLFGQSSGQPSSQAKAYRDADIAKLASLTYLRHLSVSLFCDSKFTFLDSWQLESLHLHCHRGWEAESMQDTFAFQGSVTALETLILLLPHQMNDAVLQSLVALGVPSTLRTLSWLGSVPFASDTVQLFSSFTNLKRLQFGTPYDGPPLYAALSHLQCELEHIHMPWDLASRGEASMLFQALSETPAVRQCRSIGLPWASTLKEVEVQRLVASLPLLQKIVLRHDSPYTAGHAMCLLERVGRPIEVQWTDDYNDAMTHLAAADEAFSGVRRL